MGVARRGVTTTDRLLGEVLDELRKLNKTFSEEGNGNEEEVAVQEPVEQPKTRKSSSSKKK